MNPRLRNLIGLSTVLTGGLVILGVYTAASGAGLTCAGRWPFCDGYLGLFPATWSSFVEWFHRFVAMITGFILLGTTVFALREGAAPRIRRSLMGATLLLPSQIILGGLTVRTYEWVILSAHFITASLIFTGITMAYIYTLPTPERATLTNLSLGTVGIASALLLLTPHQFVTFGPQIQSLYYAIGLCGFGLLLGISTWGESIQTDSIISLKLISGLTAGVLLFLLVVGRQVFDGIAQYASITAGVLLVGLTVTCYILLRKSAPSTSVTGRVSGD
jgi:cytochrome c oxidase assembly protein subunit 15